MKLITTIIIYIFLTGIIIPNVSFALAPSNQLFKLVEKFENISEKKE